MPRVEPRGGGLLRALLGLIALLQVAALYAALYAEPVPRPEEPIPLDAGQEERYRTLIHELRCLVCQNQTIADSNAPLAADLRQQVRKQLAAGQDESAIRGYLTDRYGDFVLYRPPLKFRTLLLWAAPGLLLALALLLALRYTRRQRRRSVAAVDPAALRRLLDEES